MMKKLLVSAASGAMALLAGEVLAGDWYVKSDAAEGGDGSCTAPFKTIQQAVDAASADDSGFTFEDGTAHQSAAPGNIAAGGLCAPIPIGAILPAAEPKTGILKLVSQRPGCFRRGRSTASSSIVRRSST